ncbi:MAG: hypothetical protein K2Q21_10445 [Chitinophagaceae bacterium]|nr:hypothetical protein [Chitinophagaceae bacterium]
MKKIIFFSFFLGLIAINAIGQVAPNTKPKPYSGSKPSTSANDAGRENVFPANGFVGIGIPTPSAPLEIKRGAGNTTKKNILLKLSNEWAPSGQNEPSIMFSNGNATDPKNISYWTIGARVSGDNTLKTAQTFKISYKSATDLTERDFFSVDSYEGRVRIGEVGTQYDGYKLYVEQGILTEKVKVAVKDSKDWYDNVFEKNYELISIKKLEKFIQDNKHLPDVPSTEEVMKNGVDLGKMNGLLLKKVEELTLYMISLKKELDETKASLEELKNKH